MKRHFLLTIAMIAAVLLSLVPSAVYAKSEYTYTVRIYPGNQGEFVSGDEVLIFSGLGPDSRVNFDPDMVRLPEGSKYYVTGIKETGKDNKDGKITLSSFSVDRDVDYVVSYGVLGDPVEYTVNYVDENGKKLLESSIYIGNVGDDAVIAFRYVAGYQPQAYNLKFKLKRDPAENVISFIYIPTPESVTVVNPSSGDSGESGEQSEGGQPGEQEGGNEQNGGETPVTPPPPEEIIDIDPPLGPGESEEKKISPWSIVAITAAVALVSFLFIILIKRRKDKDEDREKK